MFRVPVARCLHGAAISARSGAECIRINFIRPSILSRRFDQLYATLLYTLSLSKYKRNIEYEYLYFVLVDLQYCTDVWLLGTIVAVDHITIDRCILAAIECFSISELTTVTTGERFDWI